MALNSTQWHAKPKFPETHYVDTRLYTDETLFREEQEKIFAKSWIIACHESELPSAVRLPDVPASGRHAPHRRARRGHEDRVRSTTSARTAATRCSTIPSAARSGSTCIFHAWSFDTTGRCLEISRGKQGYQDRFKCEDAGLREVRTAVGYGGFVWVNIDDDAISLQEYIGDALGMLEPHMSMPLEVFHYHKAVVNTNYKLWHDTNSEFYHDYMHYFNRITGMLQPGYFDRKYVGYPQRPCIGRVDADQVRRVRRQQGARRRLAGPRAGRLDPDRHLPRHDVQPAHLGDPHGHGDPAGAEQGHRSNSAGWGSRATRPSSARSASAITT